MNFCLGGGGGGGGMDARCLWAAKRVGLDIPWLHRTYVKYTYPPVTGCPDYDTGEHGVAPKWQAQPH